MDENWKEKGPNTWTLEEVVEAWETMGMIFECNDGYCVSCRKEAPNE